MNKIIRCGLALAALAAAFSMNARAAETGNLAVVGSQDVIVCVRHLESRRIRGQKVCATRNLQQTCRPIWPLSDFRIIHIMRNVALEQIIC
jgi:hypothetical protein